MPLRSAPLLDLPAAAAGWAHTSRAVHDLGRSLRPGDAERATACPGWSVHDQIAHVVSLEAWVQGESVPDLDSDSDLEPDPDGRVRELSPLDAIVEKHLESRRHRPLDELLEELDELIDTRLRYLESDTVDAGEEAVGPFGPTTLLGLTRTRLFDVWVHEQDIRSAIGRPGNLDSPGAAVVVHSLFAALPRIVSRTAHVPVGQAVILDVTGPMVGRAGARVEDHEGKPHGIPLFSGDAEPHADTETTTITLSTDAATRRAAGRVPTADTHYTVTGDDDIARRVLDALVITP